MSEPPDESTRDIWRKVADNTKDSGELSEDLPKAEDLVEGPLPETELEREARIKKLEAAKRAEEAKNAEEAKRLEQLKREEEARKAAEDAKRAVEQARLEQEAKKAPATPTEKPEDAKAPPPPEPGKIPESENLLLVGLMNLLQPALDIKLESKKYQRWIKGWDKIIEMHILNEGYSYIVIKDDKITSHLGKAPREADIVIEGEYEAITNYLNGELDPILMFFDFVLLRKIKLVKGLHISLSNLLSGGILKQASDLYKIDKIIKIS